MGAISFDGNSLQTDNIITSVIDDNSSPEKQVSVIQVAHGNRSKVTFSEFPKKIITIEGLLKADTISDFDDLLDDFKGYFTNDEAFLDIEHGSGTRRYVATLASDSLPRTGGLMYSNFTLQFTCSEPFSRDIDLTNLDTVAGVTGSMSTSTFTSGGNAKYQYPIIQITLNSGTGLTNATISVSNDDNGQVINITDTFAPGDVILIDSFESDITLNGTEHDFSGSIPILQKGPGSLTITDTFTTRNIDYTIDQYQRWS